MRIGCGHNLVGGRDQFVVALTHGPIRGAVEGLGVPRAPVDGHRGSRRP